MRILVTGDTGFLGKRVVEQCKNKADVFGSKGYDLRINDECAHLLYDTRPEVVIHLAASVGGIGANQKNPGSFFYDNLIMGTNLIEMSRRYRVKQFVQIGTVCCYPKFCEVPFKEESLWDGYPEETNAPYGIAKKALLTMLQAYRDQYNFRSVFLIPTNLYGPGDNFNENSSHVIPALIKKIYDAKKNNETLKVWGTGSATREFLYVDDAARAICGAVERVDDASPVNLGGGEEISIKDLTEMLCWKMNYNGPIEWDSSKPDGQPRRKVDNSRAQELLRWKPVVDFDTGLNKTIKYYYDLIGEEV